MMLEAAVFKPQTKIDHNNRAELEEKLGIIRTKENTRRRF